VVWWVAELTNTKLTSLPKTKNKIKDLRQIGENSTFECFLLKDDEE
jgi:hypothetical protein